MIKKSELWQRIRAARLRIGLRQSDVSDHLGVDRTAITQWEAKDPGRRTRPNIDRLEEFARLTKTPLWWLLSDDSDIEESWPQVADEQGEATEPKGTTLLQHIRDFWSAASLKARERRQDLWGDEIWSPRGPRWMDPITPDAMTKKAVVTFVASVRPDLARIAAAAGGLLAFEKSINTTFDKKAILIWRPKLDSGPPELLTYLKEIDRIRDSAVSLTDSLGISYLEVPTTDLAAEYLTQIL